MTAEDLPAGTQIVWIVDSQQWPRAYLRAELIECGYQAVGFTNPAPALLRLAHHGYAKPDLIVLELADLNFQPADLPALFAAGIPILLLGGFADLNDPQVREGHWARVMRRPFTIGDVADAVSELLRRGGSPDQPAQESA